MEARATIPQLVIVDDDALAQSCASLIPDVEWASLDGDCSRAKDRKCVIVGRAGAAHRLEMLAQAKRVLDAGAAQVKTVCPERGRKSDWGLDNALQDGWDRNRIVDWMRALAEKYPPPESKSRTLKDIWADKVARAEQKRRENPKYPLWQEWNLQLGANGGAPLSNLHNTVAILENDPALVGTVSFDSFLQRIMRSDGREWGDADDISLALYLQRGLGLARVGREIVSQSVICVAYQRASNCVRDWLDSLIHDGEARVDTFFERCLGAEDSEYVRAASRNFWLSMVARIYTPGCKVDNMVVLEGSQGLGKSSALQIIGGDWFAEQHESATNPKAFAEVLQGKLLIEISEMDSFNRAEVNRVKQTVSCPSDRFRASYARHASDHPRQCIFVGTTNRDDWNRDETGARRFWPIACGEIKLELVRAEREQLFAEAAARHKSGEPHWLMPADATKGEQEARYQADPWLSPIEDIIKGESRVTSSHVAEKLNIPLERRDKGTEMRIGACLRFLGWHRKLKRVDGEPVRIYIRPE